MKRHITTLIFLIFCLCSCFNDDTETAKSDISEVKISSEYKSLSFLALQSPNFGVKIDQSGNKEISYQWSYGPRSLNEGEYPISGEQIIISNDSLLTYKFPYLGKYTLKLVVDNGESCDYIYFDLNVSNGFDEGLAILTEDAEGKGNVSFYKTLSDKEIGDGVEEKIITDIYNELDIQGPVAIHSPNDKSVYITDKQGKIYVLNQQTLNLDMISRPEVLEGSYLTNLSAYFYVSSGERLGCYCFTNDNKVFRFNSSIGMLETLKTTDKYFEFAYEEIDATHLLQNNYRYQHYINYEKSKIYGIYGSDGYFNDYSDDYNLLSVAYPHNKSGSYMYIAAQKKDEPGKYVVLKEHYRLNRTSILKTFELPAELTINEDTEFINSEEYDDYVFYVYKNKIYRWDFAMKPIPLVNEYISFDLPETEQIQLICFNGDDLGTKLFVLTYDETKTSKYKGSLYVFDPDTFERIQTFENVMNKPVDAIYKIM